VARSTSLACGSRWTGSSPAARCCEPATPADSGHGGIDPPQSLPLAVAEVTPDEIEPRLVALARQPFTLDTRWPVRADLLRVAPDDHVLLVSLHHIAADGWSVGLLAERLGSAYTGATPAEPVQYADVTHARAQADNESELVYWTRRLAGVPTPLTLPTDRPRPAAAGDAGAMTASSSMRT
jgi:hypothetical protein